jgi:hypothetical protein
MRHHKVIAFLLGTASLFASGHVLAGGCTAKLDALQGDIDGLVEAAAAKGSFAVESKAATENRQPTPESMSDVEVALGEGEKAHSALAALGRGRKADEGGDEAGCERAIAEARKILGR